MRIACYFVFKAKVIKVYISWAFCIVIEKKSYFCIRIYLWKILSTNEYDKDDGNEKDDHRLFDECSCHDGNVCTDTAEKGV